MVRVEVEGGRRAGVTEQPLSEIVRRMRDGRLRTNIGTTASLDDAVAAFNSTERRKGKTVIRVRP